MKKKDKITKQIEKKGKQIAALPGIKIKGENKKNSGKNSGESKVPPNLQGHEFKPGQSGNPNGRPKGKLNFDTRVDMAIEVLAQKYVTDINEKNKNKRGYKPITLDDVDIEGDIFLQYLNMARNGKEKMVIDYMDRRHGKATAKIELTGKDGDPIVYEERKKEAKSKARRMLDMWVKK